MNWTCPLIFNGQILDVSTFAEVYGGTEKQARARAARGLLPHRRWGGRLVFLKREIDQFFDGLPGVSLEEARQNLMRRSSSL